MNDPPKHDDEVLDEPSLDDEPGTRFLTLEEIARLVQEDSSQSTQG